MAFVLDASVAASWAFDDEVFEAAISALGRLQTEPAWVPAIWWFELRNSLLMNEQGERLSRSMTEDFLAGLAEFAIVTDNAPNELGLFDLARRHRLTIYDASYLELAMRKSLALATLDRALIRGARAERVSLLV